MDFHGFGFMGIWGLLFWIVMLVVMFYLLRLLLPPFLPEGRTRLTAACRCTGTELKSSAGAGTGEGVASSSGYGE